MNSIMKKNLHWIDA